MVYVADSKGPVREAIAFGESGCKRIFELPDAEGSL